MVAMAADSRYVHAGRRRRRIQLEVAGGVVCVDSCYAVEDAVADFCAEEQAVTGAAASKVRMRALFLAMGKKRKRKVQAAFPGRQSEGDTLQSGLPEAANFLVN